MGRLDQYLTSREASKLLNNTPQEVCRKIWRGILKADLKGRTYLIHKSEIERYLKEKRSG